VWIAVPKGVVRRKVRDWTPPNGMAFSCRARWVEPSKTARSRAQRSTAMPGWALRRPDRFPLRSLEASAARVKRPSHQAWASTPQASETAPRHVPCVRTARLMRHEHQLPRHPACASNEPSDEAWTATPQAPPQHPRHWPRGSDCLHTRHGHHLPRHWPHLQACRATRHRT